MFLQIDQVDVRYSGQPRPAVQQVALGLAAGDIGVLIGPSGCGKTTLLRAVAGLERVTAGTIHLSGELVSGARLHVPPEARRIGMVFQDYALFPHLDVGRNVAFGLKHLPARERARRVTEVLALVDLAVTERLAPLAPSDALLVAESGIFTPHDVARVQAAGARAILVGESLMRQDNVEAATTALLQ